MRDELNIPMPEPIHASGPSYRIARNQGMDPYTKRLVLIASGIGGVLLLVLGAWQATGHRHGAVPVIEADSRPLRVKPDNPGGLAVSGQDDAILSGISSGKEGLAPPPETPEPQALQAPSAPPPAVPAPAAPAAVVAPTAELAKAAPPAPAKPTPTTVAPATASATPGTKAVTVVQLAALPSEAGALAEWQRLSKRMPELLGSRKPAVVKISRDGKTFYRLRTSGFTTVAEAAGFCEQVRAKGAACAVATF